VAGILREGGVHRSLGVRFSYEARQVQAHRRPFSRLGVDAHLPTRLTNETVNHGQPEARALPERLRREERVENLRNDVRRHPGASIRHAQGNVLARRKLTILRRAIVQPFVGGLYRDAAAIGHRVARIDA
jgi:hypothetical protein